MQNEIDQLETAISEVNDRVVSLESQKEASDRPDQQSEDVRVARLEAVIQSLEQRIVSLERKPALDQSIIKQEYGQSAKLQGQIDTINARVSNIEPIRSDIPVVISAVNRELYRLSDSVRDLRSSADYAEAMIASLTDSQDNLGPDIRTEGEIQLLSTYRASPAIIRYRYPWDREQFWPNPWINREGSTGNKTITIGAGILRYHKNKIVAFSETDLVVESIDPDAPDRIYAEYNEESDTPTLKLLKYTDDPAIPITEEPAVTDPVTKPTWKFHLFDVYLNSVDDYRVIVGADYRYALDLSGSAGTPAVTSVVMYWDGGTCKPTTLAGNVWEVESATVAGGVLSIYQVQRCVSMYDVAGYCLSTGTISVTIGGSQVSIDLASGLVTGHVGDTFEIGTSDGQTVSLTVGTGGTVSGYTGQVVVGDPATGSTSVYRIGSDGKFKN